MQHRPMLGVFITGTDTGVGKTHIGVLLAKALSAKNIRVIPRKPVESGCAVIDGELMPADAQALKQAADYSGGLSDICRYRFEAPVSPPRAAHLANRPVTTEQLLEACVHNRENGFTLVEGAGGFYSPLSEDGLNADLATALQLPVLLVAEDALGALNQVLMSVEAIQAHGLNLVGVVLNRLNKLQDERMDNAADLRERLDCAVFVQEYNNDCLPDELVNRILTPPATASPHFSPGSREQAQDEARMSHQMDEPSLDL